MKRIKMGLTCVCHWLDKKKYEMHSVKFKIDMEKEEN